MGFGYFWIFIHFMWKITEIKCGGHCRKSNKIVIIVRSIGGILSIELLIVNICTETLPGVNFVFVIKRESQQYSI